MCTAITYQADNHYFGRNLDLDYSYHETITITPRNFPLYFREVKNLETHYAIIGMAYVTENYPLYYDAVNEAGLSMAGLHFPDNTEYKKYRKEKDNIASFELLPWILGQCATVEEAESLLLRMNIRNTDFNEKLLAAPLHWILADRNRAITIEAVKEGLRIYENPVGVLTNNPPFLFHVFHVQEFRKFTRDIPGDLSPSSRFIKAAFTKEHAISGENEMENVSQFFHILRAVEQQKGCALMENGNYEYTIYTSCCNTDLGIYYYTTYHNHQICAVDMHREDLNGKQLYLYELEKDMRIFYQN